MMTSRSKWDVTTAEGLEAIERFLMERMGFKWTHKCWRYHLGGHVDEGWLFTGDGMVWAKEWAAEHKSIVISSQVNEGGQGAYAEACWSDEFGSDDVTVEAWDEPTAVALALARALEEMERTA